MKKPTFLIIGAPKAGTTSLYHYLLQHPQIYMSPVKEPSFFALAGENLDILKSGNHSTTNWEDYLKLFQGATEEHLAIGEVSTTYLYSSKAPILIKKYLSDVKLIAVLRDPVERAYSNYQMIARSNYKPLKSFLEEIQNEEIRLPVRRYYRIRPITPYIGGGFYYNLLTKYLDIFDKSQIKIMLYEDFKRDNVETIKDIFTFIGVEREFTPNVSIKYNASILKNNKKHSSSIQSKIIKSPILKYFLSTSNKDTMIESQDTEQLNNDYLFVRQKLIHIYREDISKLQNLLQKDLSKWMK